MDQHRLGKCSDCDAQYRVPATFKADKAKCKKCGGVVEIGPVQGGEPAPVKAGRAKAAPSKATARPGAKRNPAGRAAPAADAAPAKISAKGDSVRSAAESAAARVRGTEGGAKAPAGGTRRHRRTRAPKKKSKAPIVLGLVGLILIAGGGGWFLWNKQRTSEAQAAESLVAAPPAETAESGDGEATPNEPQATAPAKTPAAPAAASEAPAAADAGEGNAEDAAAEDEAAAPPTPAWEIDLGELADQAPLPETSDAEWEEMTGLVETMLDPAAGARGGRAGKALEEKGRVAFPAILNAFKQLDLTTQQGYRDGDQLQQLLMNICNGNNFGWRYTTENDDVGFNKKVVQAWFQGWAQVVDNPKAWIGLANLDDDQKQAYLAEIGLESAPGAADELDDF